MDDATFWETFYVSFAKGFEFYVEYPINFPEPIGTVTLFNITAFLFVADILVSLATTIAYRGKNDDE